MKENVALSATSDNIHNLQVTLKLGARQIQIMVLPSWIRLFVIYSDVTLLLCKM